MRQGFSLVELSIVLVILGLLVGGVLTGQSLIRAAELRSVTTEFEKYQAAVNTFRDKYFQIPGDMNNATSFWGAAHATPATCLTTVGTGTQTCNGDGDGIVENAAAVSQRGEAFAFWVHLANAGLIEGTYSGFTDATGTGHGIIGTNVPRAKLGNAGWYMLARPNMAADANFYDNDYGNSFTFGAATTGTTYGAVLKPEEAWNIDTKMDDGQPARGKLFAIHWNNLCAAADDGTHASSDLAASYKLTDTALRCGLIFKQVF